MIKLIALDMDGTTLSPDNEITAANRQAILAAQEQRIEVVISTGRSNTELVPILKQFPEIRYFICGNGSKIYDKELQKNIYEKPLSLELARTFLTHCAGQPVMPEVYANDKIYTLRLFYDNFSRFIDSSYAYITELIHQSRTPVDNLQTLLNEWNCPVEKLNIFFREQATGEQLFTYFSAYDVCLTGSLTNNIEVGNAAASKGSALSWLADRLLLDASQVMAIGDADNDISMLNYADCSVAMGNAIPTVIQAARYQTLTNQESGVAAAIKKYALRRELA